MLNLGTWEPFREALKLLQPLFMMVHIKDATNKATSLLLLRCVCLRESWDPFRKPNKLEKAPGTTDKTRNEAIPTVTCHQMDHQMTIKFTKWLDTFCIFLHLPALWPLPVVFGHSILYNDLHFDLCPASFCESSGWSCWGLALGPVGPGYFEVTCRDNHESCIWKPHKAKNCEEYIETLPWRHDVTS